jgi:hypothetical protein
MLPRKMVHQNLYSYQTLRFFLYSSPDGDGDVEVGGKRGVEEAEGWISY